MVKMTNVMLFVFYHNEKKMGEISNCVLWGPMKHGYLLRGCDYENIRNGASLTHVGEGSTFLATLRCLQIPTEWQCSPISGDKGAPWEDGGQVPELPGAGEVDSGCGCCVSWWSQGWSPERSDLPKSLGLSLPLPSWLIITALGGFGCSFC